MSGNAITPRNQMRERIAQLAARLMAEDGVQDFGLAKRKAARQLGVNDTRNLPNNTEIETALRDYLALYQGDEQRERILEMRRQALVAMRELAPFDPHLYGPALAGTAARYSEISLMLFADSAKEVELYLLNRNIPFKPGEKHFHFGDKFRNVPALSITGGTFEGIEAAILTTADLRQPPRHAGAGNPIEKARQSEVETMLGGQSLEKQAG